MSSQSPPGNNRTDPSSTLPRRFDRVLEALAHRDRRVVLTALIEANLHSDESVPLEWTDLTSGMTPQELIGASHTHLPKLEDFGFVTWDRDANVVHAGPEFDDVRAVVELLTANADELPDGLL